MAILVFIAIVTYMCIEMCFLMKAEVISWKWEAGPWHDETCFIHVLVKTRFGEKRLVLVWKRDENGSSPACIVWGYKMEIMAPMLGRKVLGQWWIDEKDVRRC